MAISGVMVGAMIPESQRVKKQGTVEAVFNIRNDEKLKMNNLQWRAVEKRANFSL
jgi:hypothetical protein